MRSPPLGVKARDMAMASPPGVRVPAERIEQKEGRQAGSSAAAGKRRHGREDRSVFNGRILIFDQEILISYQEILIFY